MLNYRDDFFYKIVKSRLGYTPSIASDPVHVANGLFRAICGGYVDNEAQHQAVCVDKYPRLVPGAQNEIAKFARFTDQQRDALTFLDDHKPQREMLHSLLAADKTVFKSVGTSSYSLSHASQITSDNHDRDVGMWLCSILSWGSDNAALNLLRSLLMQEPERCNDEISVLTLPLDNPQVERKQKSYNDWSPNSLRTQHGEFCDPLVRNIRRAFDQLAKNDGTSAQRNGKLDTLRRFAALACLAVYAHLVNSGNKHSHELLPLVLRFDKSGPTLHQASRHSYQRAMRSIDEFMRTEITSVVSKLAESGEYGSWDNDEDIKKHVYEDINWYQRSTPKSRSKEEPKVKGFKAECWQFYQSYRGETAEYSVADAFANAATDMLGRVFSSKPQDVARNLGTMIGILGRSKDLNQKSYVPQPDLAEVLVRATIPKGKTWTLGKLAECWAQDFGILTGVLGDENTRLEAWGIPPIDTSELSENVSQLAELLEMSGYARRYADGVVLVAVNS